MENEKRTKPSVSVAFIFEKKKGQIQTAAR